MDVLHVCFSTRRRRRWACLACLTALVLTAVAVVVNVGKYMSTDVPMEAKDHVARREVRNANGQQTRNSQSGPFGSRIEMVQHGVSDLNQQGGHGVNILGSQTRLAIQPQDKRSQLHSTDKFRVSNSEAKPQKQMHGNGLDVKSTSSQLLLQNKEGKQRSFNYKLNSPLSSFNQAATRVHLLQLPNDEAGRFVQFLRRSLGCGSRTSCCFDSLECKDCGVLRHPCRVKDAFSLRIDASVVSAILIQHPVQRVMSCFVNARFGKRSCTLPNDITTAVANKKMSVKEFVSHNCTSNVLTRALLGDSLLPCKSGKITQDQFETAKALLLKIDFVGLKEYLPQSARLFQTQLKQRGFVKFVNVSTNDIPNVLVSPVYGEEHRQQCLSDEETIAIYRSNKYDLKLYEHAVDIFFQQLCTSGVHCYPMTELSHAVMLDADPYYWYRSPYAPLPQIISFLHIPKTAGSAFVRVLRQAVGCDSVCWCTGTCHSSCPYVVGQCGHNSDVPTDVCGGQPVVAAVIMRDPVQRLVSNYEHAKTVKKGECCGLPRSVSDAVNDSKNSLSLTEFSSRNGVSNAMTRMLAGFDVYDPTVVADQKTLEKAMSQLTHFAFIGLQEHYDESVKLFYKTMKSSVDPPKSAFEVLNRRRSAMQLSERDLNQIQASNSLDVQLYSMAKRLFYERLCEAKIACHKENS